MKMYNSFFLLCQSFLNIRAKLFQNLLLEHRQLTDVHKSVQADLQSKGKPAHPESPAACLIYIFKLILFRRY